MIAGEITKLASSKEGSTSMGSQRWKSKNALALKKSLHLQSRAQVVG